MPEALDRPTLHPSTSAVPEGSRLAAHISGLHIRITDDGSLHPYRSTIYDGDTLVWTCRGGCDLMSTAANAARRWLDRTRRPTARAVYLIEADGGFRQVST